MHFLISYRSKTPRSRPPETPRHLTVTASSQREAATKFRQRVQPNHPLEIVGIRKSHCG